MNHELWPLYLTASTVTTVTDEGNPDEGGGSGGGEPEAVSDEVRTLLSRTANAAVTSHLQRKLPGMVTEAVKAAFEAANVSKESAPTNGEGTSETAALANRVKQLEAQNKASEKARKDDATSHRRDLVSGDLRKRLTDANVRPELIEGAIAVVSRDLTISDDGSAFFRKDRGGYHDDLSVGDGVAEWLGTDQGKAHLKPMDVEGSGATQRRGGGPKPGKTPMNPKEAKALKKQEDIVKLGEQMRDMMTGGSVGLTPSKK